MGGCALGSYWMELRRRHRSRRRRPERVRDVDVSGDCGLTKAILYSFEVSLRSSAIPAMRALPILDSRVSHHLSYLGDRRTSFGPCTRAGT
jgi:hypothetical protein